MDFSLGKFGEYYIRLCSQNFAILFELNHKRKTEKPSCTRHEGFLLYLFDLLITKHQMIRQQLLYRSAHKL